LVGRRDVAFEFLLYDVEDGILTLRLNRPEKLNAVNGQVNAEIVAAFDQADEDDDVRAVVVTGEGRAFCAGADLSGGADTFDYEEDQVRRDGGGLVTLRMFDFRKPIIAAINGPAVGMGVTMTLAMDVRLASEEARFGFVFARRGIVPESCSTWFLPRIVGVSQALDWIYSGRVFGAQEALEAGLVRAVYPREELLPVARELAKSYTAESSAISVGLSRQMVWKLLGADHPMEAHKLDSRGVYELGKGVDAREGVESFLEKRAPAFTMKVSKDMPGFYPWWAERPFE
jgi:enoyl-CoA hydratase/carnithine racemase